MARTVGKEVKKYDSTFGSKAHVLLRYGPSNRTVITGNLGGDGGTHRIAG